MPAIKSLWTSGDCLPESGDDVDLLSGDLKRGWIPD